ncbi:MAG: hypothetical protein FWC15_09320, partial [Fibromonadales bacterium]|nr:hypothetical protein [Fibromonadales bacterium]
LKDFLERHSQEVYNMLYGDWNIDEAREVWEEEAMAMGEAKGIAIGMEKVFALLEQGVPLAEAKSKLGL